MFKILLATLGASSLLLASCTQQVNSKNVAQAPTTPATVEVQQTAPLKPKERTPDVVYVPTPTEQLIYPHLYTS